MTTKEKREHDRLHRKWATGKATMREMDRCMELNRQAAHERRESYLKEQYGGGSRDEHHH